MQKMSLHTFVDLNKVFDRVLRDTLRRVLQKYGIDGHLLIAFKSFYCQQEVCVCIKGKQPKLFYVVVGLGKRCVLSTLLFRICINWKNNLSETDECVTIGRCKISRLLSADDLIWLASSDSRL